MLQLDYRYKYQILENDPRSQQPENIKTVLKPHQLASLHKALLLERHGQIKYHIVQPEETVRRRYGLNSVFKGNFVIHSNIGVVGDMVGYGKTLTSLAIIASTPTKDLYVESGKVYAYYGVNSNSHIRVECEGQPDTDERVVFGTTLVVVPKGPVYTQWENALRENTTLKYLAIDDLRFIKKKCPPTGSTNEQLKVFFEGYDVVLVKNTSLDKLMEHYDIPFQKYPIRGFDRIMIDEAHDILAKVRLLKFKFLWFITASYNSISMYGSNYNMSCVVKELISEERLNTILVKCDNEFTKKSFHVPAYHEIIYRCLVPRSVSIVQPFLTRDVMELVNANDIEGAIRELGGTTETEDNIVKVVTRNLQREIHNKQREKDYVEGLDLNSEAKTTRLRTITNDLEKLNNQMADLEKRIVDMSNGTCSICYDTMETPIILPCTHMFCGQCIMQWIETVDTTTNRMNGIHKVCPICRTTIEKKEDLTAIVKKQDLTIKKEAGPSKPIELSKPNTVLKIIQENPEGRFLIFSQFDNAFVEMIQMFDQQDISTSELKGTTQQMTKILDRFKNGELKVILLNTYHAGSGIDISCATDVILFHNMGSRSEQAIGRAQRVGRTNMLTVHRLHYPHEMA
jgi:SNF2 family DNA or RNA helicase